MEEFVRTIPTLSAMALTLALAACRNDAHTGPDAMTADLDRDLQLASSAHSTRAQAVSAVELTSNDGPSGNQRGERSMVTVTRRAPVASHSSKVSDVAVPNLPALQHGPAVAPTVTESAPAPAHGPSAETVASADQGQGVAAAVGANTGSSESYGRGNGGNGSGSGPAIIRGGPAGQDHCSPHGRHGGGMMGGMGGILGGGRRFP